MKAIGHKQAGPIVVTEALIEFEPVMNDQSTDLCKKKVRYLIGTTILMLVIL